MPGPPRTDLLSSSAGALTVTASVILALALRLIDPLTNPAVPAEDPYTHMAFTRQHLATGNLTPLDDGTSLYPPGLHALMAAVWTYTGMDLYILTLYGPVLLGGLGVAGMALLLWRHLGRTGAIIGSLGYAVAPEVIFRTTMMSPTAVDLALLPFLLYALLEIAGGRFRWLAVAAPITLFFVFAHPWLLAILALTVTVFVALSLLAPRTTLRGTTIHLMGLASVLAVIGIGFGLALTGCDGYCGPGMTKFLPTSLQEPWVPPIVIAASLGVLLAVAIHQALRYRHETKRYRKDGPLWVVDDPGPGYEAIRTRRHSLHHSLIWLRFMASTLIIAAVLFVTYPAVQQGMPEHVDLPRMFGWPILVLAGIGLALLPFARNQLAFLGAGLVVATFPFVIYNVFDSPYWPHRTAVFFGVGLVILFGHAANLTAQWLTRQAIRLHQAISRSPRPSLSAFFIPPILLVGTIGGAVYTETPGPYPDGWYRLYDECEIDALRAFAEDLEEEDKFLVITGSWQSRLILIGQTGRPDKFWFDPSFFQDPERRNGTLSWQDGPTFVLVDAHMQENDITLEHLAFLVDSHTWPEAQPLCVEDYQARMWILSTGGPTAEWL